MPTTTCCHAPQPSMAQAATTSTRITTAITGITPRRLRSTESRPVNAMCSPRG